VTSLREIQQAFVGAGLAGDPGPFASRFIVGGGVGEGRAGPNTGQRLNVYRNNALHNYREALRSVYPVLERLVGERFFDYAADQYAIAHPSASGDIHRFGAAMPDFLSTFGPAAALAYLPDTARLEWAMHAVFHAADHAPLSLERLAELAQCSDALLRCTLHPACRLLASSFPIDRIWAVNQPGVEWDDTLDVDGGGALLLVRRRGFEVELDPLEKGEFALLQALAAGQVLSQACDRARQADPGFDAAQCIRRHIAEATIVDYSTLASAMSSSSLSRQTSSTPTSAW
jgi:hypothetical protein